MVRRPSVLITQQFVDDEVTQDATLFPVVIGPMYQTLSFADNKEAIELGAYDRDNAVEYPYPSKESGTEVRTESVQLIFDEAKLRYFEKTKDSGDYEFRIVGGTKNKIRTGAALPSNTLVFKNSVNAAGTQFSRSPVFYDRDVQVGDQVIASNGVEELVADVTRLESEIVPSEVSAAVANPQNILAQSESISLAVAGGSNTGDDAVVTSGTYVGSLENNVTEDIYTLQVVAEGADPVINVTPDPGNDADGDSFVIDQAVSIFDDINSDTYTIEVTTAGAPGVAEISWTSLRGDDSTAPVVVAAFGTNIVIGTKGLQGSFTDGGSGDLALGDRFEVTATPSTGRIRVTTQSGVDDNINRIFPGFGAPFPLASFGVDVEFTDGGDTTLTAGDTWTITTVKEVEAVIATSGGNYSGSNDLTYTVEVTRGGEFGNAEITVISTATDSSGPTIVSAADTDVPIGNFNASISFASNLQNGLVKGDKWTVPVISEKDGKFNVIVLNKNFSDAVMAADAPVVAAPVADGGNTQSHAVTIAGTYVDNGSLSERDKETYIIETTTGGAPGVAEYTVTSASGKDDAAAASISAFATALPIGSAGLTISWADAGSGIFTAGDIWEVDIDKQNLSVELRLVKNGLEVPRLREDIPAQFAWEVDEDSITVNPSINLSVPEWRSGTEALEVKEANQFAPYQVFVPKNDGIQIIKGSASKGEVAEVLGSSDPDSILGYGVYVCSQNSPNVSVKYLGLSSDDADGWDAALAILKKNDEVYFLNPLTTDTGIHNRFKTHVEDMAAPDKKRWRVFVTAADVPLKEEVYETYFDSFSETERDFTAIVIDDPNTAGTQYTLVEFDPSEPIDLTTQGLEAGDIFRYNYQTDSNGDVIFSEYEIAEIISATSLLLKTGPVSGSTLYSKAAVYKSLSKGERIQTVKEKAEALNSSRAFLLFPGEAVDNDGETVSSIFLASAVCGLKASLLPHQGITNYELAGFSAVPFVRDELDETDLDDLANSGVFIINQNTDSDIPFVRHQLSTDVSSEETQEMSIRTNADQLSYFYDLRLAGFIGRANIVETAIDEIRSELAAAIEAKRELVVRLAGPQLIDGEIVRLEQDPTFRTQLNIILDQTIPAPLNNIDLTLRLSI